jgi:uridine phosphorylase
MMQRYFKGIPPHINIERIEGEIAFLPGPPERALEIAKKFSAYEKVTKQREFVTYKGEIENKANMAVENAIRVAVGAVKYINLES